MINPQDYVPSAQVQQLIGMIIDTPRTQPAFMDHGERRFNDGTRHGLNLAYRALVVRETEIDDPDVLDELCGDMIAEAMINRA